jgi:hypothetical protein
VNLESFHSDLPWLGRAVPNDGHIVSVERDLSYTQPQFPFDGTSKVKFHDPDCSPATKLRLVTLRA